MATLDLKPLSEETIKQMDFKNHDLWLVKIHDEIFGPFETESLKHYAYENEGQFEEALATRLEEDNYQDFWSHPFFQRRKVQAVVSPVNHEGPFWVLEYGLKTGPLSFSEVNKKIEMGLLGMTDHVSVNDGETWNKIYTFKGFDRRLHKAEELPDVPVEDSFQRAKLALIEKLESSHTHTSDAIAALMAQQATGQGNLIHFNLDEISHNKRSEISVSKSLKWILPTAIALGLVMASSGYFMLNEEVEAPIIAQSSESVKPRIKKTVSPTLTTPKGRMPSVSNVVPTITPVGAPIVAPVNTPRPTRAPASVKYQQPVRPRAINNQQSRYPTAVETHNYPDQIDDYGYDEHLDRDPLDGPVMEANEEHSLVGKKKRKPRSAASVDDVMNGEVNLEPTVEEVSDF